MEILVALVLIGILAGTLVPAVLNQLSRGETNRIVEDLGSVETAVKSFRVDVMRWPGDLEDLVSRPSGPGDTDAYGTAYAPALASRWAGPYLERGSLPGDTLVTGRGAVIQNLFTRTSWGGRDFLTVEVTGLSKPDAQAVSLVVDGDTVVDHSTADSNGRVRWVATPTSGMRYLIGPID
jgi:type II secretory pathway pseudopilin PulG